MSFKQVAIRLSKNYVIDVMALRAVIDVVSFYNTPQKLDNPLRWMLACHTKKEARYGPNDTQEPQRSF